MLWEDFLKYARELLEISEQINDCWKLSGTNNELSGLYLQKISFSPDKSERHSILRWEHHICYSVSYSVPVLYFNVWNECGELLSLTEIWKYCNRAFRSDSCEEMYSILTQQEHPILLRPFFMIHPCKTHEILDTNNDCNPLIKFITSVGPMVNLFMDFAYAMR